MQVKLRKLEKLKREINQMGHQKKQTANEKENERPGKFLYTFTFYLCYLVLS